MDLNRFSTAIKYTLNGDATNSQKIHSEIDLKNLSWKKSILLQFPPILLKILLKIKVLWTNIGLGNSVFR